MGATRVTHEVRPHTTSPRSLLAQREIYRRGRTPVSDSVGRIRALDVAPAGPETTAQHLGELAWRFGRIGLGHSIRGLDVTRGRAFTDAALRLAPDRVRTQVPVEALGARLGQGGDDELVGAAGPRVAAAVARSQPSRTMPEAVVARVERVASRPGHDIGTVAIHDDPAAHAAARMLRADAFTVGRSVYLAAGAYRPASSDGIDLLAHEFAHTTQQDGASPADVARLPVSEPGSPPEMGADQLARGGAPASPAATRAPVQIMRRVSFARSSDVLTSNDPGSTETAATFQIAAGVPAAPHFRWTSDVTVSGNAGDPFANFTVGPHQVVRSFWLNIFWGTDANRTHRTATVATPVRDAIAVGNTWYHDPFASGRFAALGDVRSTQIEDSPGVRSQPFANPVAGRVGTRGWFNWGMSFVAAISARDSTAGAGAGAFQTLGHVYWNLSLAGNFDTTRPALGRVAITGGGKTNVGKVLDGGSGDFPVMHGGTTFNVAANAALTTT
ncbi:MAG: DUF4157 domain-containing protein [Humibacillus sp.]|nr:DUF4157 domain-containing protein [Humibacillus sp.]MDN5776253.1 DUF4157 domain-containing protein [Humibacillus sp.]